MLLLHSGSGSKLPTRNSEGPIYLFIFPFPFYPIIIQYIILINCYNLKDFINLIYERTTTNREDEKRGS
jgi:hypothetical protein